MLLIEKKVGEIKIFFLILILFRLERKHRIRFIRWLKILIINFKVRLSVKLRKEKTQLNLY